MSDGSTLLVSPCEVPSATRSPKMKRGSVDISVLECLDSTTTRDSSDKRMRRSVSLENSSSKVTWKKVLVEDMGESPSFPPGDESIYRNEKWYSRPHKQQMLMDQCLTVQIMRSLRALACEKVSSVYCEVDDDIQRFDGLIQQNEIDTKEYCERGLESYLSDERRSEVDNFRKTHKMLVINEYAQQAKLGISDPETIRDLSLSQSKQSSIKARKLALIDERDARANNDKVHMSVHMQHQDEKYFNIENARETYVREQLQLLHLLAEKEKTQRVDSVLAYLQRQEQEKQRLQRNYHLQQQEEAQRLLLAQHHQRVFQSMQMATAAYLSQNNR